MPSQIRTWKMPRDGGLGLRWIENPAGLAIGALPSGAIFTIEHRRTDGATQINQLLGSPIARGLARLYLRIGGETPICVDVIGPGANMRFGAAADRFVWEGETKGLRHRATLSLHPKDAAWLWRLEATGGAAAALPMDAVLIQDIGLGDRGFLMNNEAYASQYIDCHIERCARLGPVVMSRQNLAQGGRHPWVVHGCLDGARGFATDGLQLFGPGFRDQDAFAFGLARTCQAGGCSMSCPAPLSNPLPPRSRPARRRHGVSSASMIPTTPKRRAAPTSPRSTLSRGRTPSRPQSP